METKPYIHVVVIHKGGDLDLTLASIKDYDCFDVISNKRDQKEISKVLDLNGYYHALESWDHLESSVNKLVTDTNSHFALLLQSGETIIDLYKALAEYGWPDKKIAMVRQKDYMNHLLVNTFVFRWLLGFGTQSIGEKIEIQAANEDKKVFIIDWKDLDGN